MTRRVLCELWVLIWIKGADATHVTVAAMGLQDRLFIALIVLAMLGSVALVAVVVLPR